MERLGLMEDTLVVFTSDHGDLANLVSGATEGTESLEFSE